MADHATHMTTLAEPDASLLTPRGIRRPRPGHSGSPHSTESGPWKWVEPLQVAPVGINQKSPQWQKNEADKNSMQRLRKLSWHWTHSP